MNDMIKQAIKAVSQKWSFRSDVHPSSWSNADIFARDVVNELCRIRLTTEELPRKGEAVIGVHSNYKQPSGMLMHDGHTWHVWAIDEHGWCWMPISESPDRWVPVVIGDQNG